VTLGPVLLLVDRESRRGALVRVEGDLHLGVEARLDPRLEQVLLGGVVVAASPEDEQDAEGLALVGGPGQEDAGQCGDEEGEQRKVTFHGRGGCTRTRGAVEAKRGRDSGGCRWIPGASWERIRSGMA